MNKRWDYPTEPVLRFRPATVVAALPVAALHEPLCDELVDLRPER